MKIVIETQPMSSMRYPTVGDWVFEDDSLLIKVAETGDDDYNFLIGIHEAIEAILCKKNNIAEEDVSAFDIEFENNRTDDSEPGDCVTAPYYWPHQFATAVERTIAQEMKIQWEEYDQACLDVT